MAREGQGLAVGLEFLEGDLRGLTVLRELCGFSGCYCELKSRNVGERCGLGDRCLRARLGRRDTRLERGDIVELGEDRETEELALDIDGSENERLFEPYKP